jgi:hypothetical protein
MSNKLNLSNIFIVVPILLLFGCANQLPPGGGDVDRIPPKIVRTFPEDKTTNFKDNYIEIEFSEYVDKRSFKEALFISPAFEEQLDISWTGTTVTVEFPKGLEKDLTYVVTIGTDVVDVNNKNRMASAYSFSFSTGNKIDTRTIAGKVFGKEIEGILIFAYKFSDDTVNYLAKKPNYISQTGKDGSYKLSGLAESVYRVFAVKDQLRDFKYQADQDLIGMPFTNVPLTGKDSSYSGMDFFLTKIDTVKPRLISSVMTDRYHILVSLSKDCDSSIYKTENYFIIDSTSRKKIAVDYAYKGNTKNDEFILVQTEELIPNNRYYLFSRELTDLVGNKFKNDWRELIVSDKVDTTAPKLYKKIPENNVKIDFANPKIFFFFDDALKSKSLQSAIQFEDTLKNKIPFNIYFPDDATLLIKPDEDLKPDKKFIIKLDLSKFVDAAGNKTDSIYTTKFSTITGVEFTGLSGRINTSMQNLVVTLQNISDQKLLYTTKPDKTYNYSFKRIEPGKYYLWFYADKDSSGTYDDGYPHPFRYAEQFYFYPDTINLKPRWSITDLNINTK